MNTRASKHSPLLRVVLLYILSGLHDVASLILYMAEIRDFETLNPQVLDLALTRAV